MSSQSNDSAYRPRFCQCDRRMLSLANDAHTICAFCRGQDCLVERCLECVDWGLDQYEAYVKCYKNSLLSRDQRRELRAQIRMEKQGVIEGLVGSDRYKYI